MREHLQPDSARAGGRIGVIGDDVSAPHLQRIDADLAGRQVDQPLRHRAGHRVADTAVLAGRRLVLEHDVEPGPVLLVAVRAAHEVDNLVALDRAGPRKHRIRSDARQVVDLEGEDFAGLRDGDPPLDPMVPGMDVADEGLKPVGDVLHRPPAQHRQRDSREIVRVGVHLDAERAPHVLAQHPHLVLLQIELACVQVLHHVRRLAGVVNREALLGRVPVGDLAARLESHAGVAAELEGGFLDRIGARERLVDRSGVQGPGKAQVVAKLRMNKRCFGRKSGLHVDDRGKAFELHHQDVQAVLGLLAGLRHDCHHRFTLPAGTLERERILRR